MHCQQCHKNFASIRYAEVVDGQVIDQHLCRECLDKKQNHKDAGFEFSRPAPFLRREKDAAGRGSALFPMPTCPSCDTDFPTIKNTGMVGCAECYTTFAEELEPILLDMHVGLTHVGKTPHIDDTRSRVRADLQAKRALLKSSLGAERYEEAAILRDEIRSLETGLGATPQGSE